MPDLEQNIWQKYKGQGNFLLYGLHGDEPQQTLDDFVEQTGITFPLVHSRYTIIDFDFPVVGYPFPKQVLIDKNRVVRSIESDLDIEEMDRLITQLLAE